MPGKSHPRVARSRLVFKGGGFPIPANMFDRGRWKTQAEPTEAVTMPYFCRKKGPDGKECLRLKTKKTDKCSCQDEREFTSGWHWGPPGHFKIPTSTHICVHAGSTIRLEDDLKCGLCGRHVDICQCPDDNRSPDLTHVDLLYEEPTTADQHDGHTVLSYTDILNKVAQRLNALKSPAAASGAAEEAPAEVIILSSDE